jgi:hypothetical protein
LLSSEEEALCEEVAAEAVRVDEACRHISADRRRTPRFFAGGGGIEMATSPGSFQPVVNSAGAEDSLSSDAGMGAGRRAVHSDTILVHELRKEYPATAKDNSKSGVKVAVGGGAVGGLSLGIPQGEIFGLLGHK